MGGCLVHKERPRKPEVCTFCGPENSRANSIKFWSPPCSKGQLPQLRAWVGWDLTEAICRTGATICRKLTVQGQPFPLGLVMRGAAPGL